MTLDAASLQPLIDASVKYHLITERVLAKQIMFSR